MKEQSLSDNYTVRDKLPWRKIFQAHWYTKGPFVPIIAHIIPRIIPHNFLASCEATQMPNTFAPELWAEQAVDKHVRCRVEDQENMANADHH